MALPEFLAIATSLLKIAKTKVEWHNLLMSKQFYILCQYGVERVGSSSSPLESIKRAKTPSAVYGFGVHSCIMSYSLRILVRYGVCNQMGGNKALHVLLR